ncbi:MAG: acyltransferase family protein [Akkermansia sp.]
MRIVAMMLVLVLHLLAATHVLPLDNHDSASPGRVASGDCRLCGVNCYALITGYVCCDGTFRYERVVSLWFQVVFYTWGSLLLALLFFPQEVQLSNILHSLFPVLSGQYWYVTAYVGLFFFIPFLNALGNRLTKLQFQYLLVTVFVLFSVIPTLLHTDVFPVEEGYSIWWLGILYMLGMYVKKHGLLTEMKTRPLWMFYAGFVCFAWVFKMVLNVVSHTDWTDKGRRNVYCLYLFIAGTAVALFLIFPHAFFIRRTVPAFQGWRPPRSVFMSALQCFVGKWFLWMSLNGPRLLPLR